MRQSSRNVTVDLTRTLAIVLMVAFHFIYDLRTFGYHDWNIPYGPGWRQWREVIVTLFLLCVGIGMVYAHADFMKWKSFSRRLIQISSAAVLVSVVSYVMYPENWIYFGILHFIAVGTVLSIPLINAPRIALLAAGALLLATYFGYAAVRWPYYELFPALPWRPNDFVPLIPWLSAVWIGIAVGHSRWLKKDPLANAPYQRELAKPGQHSLLIYLVHQPVIIGVLFLIKLISEN
jgi:uncharacterized membrane protein